MDFSEIIEEANDESEATETDNGGGDGGSFPSEGSEVEPGGASAAANGTAPVDQGGAGGESFTFLNGDEELRVPLDAKFKHKVDGQEVEFVLKDALNGFSGDAAVRKRFGEFGLEKQKFEKAKTEVASKAQAIVDAIRTADLDALGMAVAEFTGEDPRNVVNTFYKTSEGQLRDYFEMSEEQRKAADLARENKILEAEQQKAKAAKDSSSREAQFAATGLEIIQSYGISREEYVEAAQSLQNMAKNGQLDQAKIETLKTLGGEKRKNATPEEIRAAHTLVAQAASNQRTISTINSVILEADPDLAKDNPEKYNQVMEDAYFEIFHPNERKRITTAEQLRTFVQKAVGGKPKADDDDPESDVEVIRGQDDPADPTSSRNSASAKLEDFEEDEWVPSGLR